MSLTIRSPQRRKVFYTEWIPDPTSIAEKARANELYRKQHEAFSPAAGAEDWKSISREKIVEYLRHVSRAMSNPELVAYSEQKFSEIEKTDTRQDRELEELRERLLRLESLVLGKPSRPRETYSIWVESKEAEQYAGLYVAFVPHVGAIASAETIEELKTKLEHHDLKRKAAIVMGP